MGEVQSIYDSIAPFGIQSHDIWDDTPDALLPEELACIKGSSQVRIRDFTAGRHCARRALRTLGWCQSPVLVGLDREPLWPKGIVGSITHTSGFCAAVVAQQQTILGIGVDAEVITDVSPEIWQQFLCQNEISDLERLPPSERQSFAALLFSAKEAYFKLHFPLRRTALSFKDLWIRPGAATFEVSGLNPKSELETQAKFRGRFRLTGERVFTLCWLEYPS